MWQRPGGRKFGGCRRTQADKAEAAYQRGTLFPKRIKLMAAWAAYCISPVADGANVRTIRAEGV